MAKFNRGKRLTSLYGFERGPAADFESLSVVAADSLMELAKTLRRAEGEISQLSDQRSAIAGGSVGAASKAAMKAAEAVYESLTSSSDYFSETLDEAISRATPHTGSFNAAFGGGAGERHTIGPIAATWVTATSVIKVISTTPIPAAPAPIFDFDKFIGTATTIIPGVSITFVVYNIGTPPAANYGFAWESLG